MKKNILLTFDYELFLGHRSGTVDNCLIRPTKKILEILRTNKAKAIFFIDTTYLYRLEELGKSNSLAAQDFNKIKEQLIEMARDGHYLFHHIHPHWLNAIYLDKENQWDLSNYDKYTWSLLSDNERNSLIEYSTVFLTRTYADAEKNSVPDGFRAGGLFIQPFIMFKNYFIKHKIKYDFSVYPGVKITGNNVGYDFTSCPDTPFYNFDENDTVEIKSGLFTEFTITQFKLTGIYKILNGLYYRLYKKRNKIYGDGNSVSLGISRPPIKNYFVSLNALSVELMNPVMTNFFVKMTNKMQYMHFISHPKLLSYQNLICLDKYLMKVMSKHQIEFDFKKFEEE